MDKYILILFIFLAGCVNVSNEVRYYHGNVEILRVDEDGKTSFNYIDKRKSRNLGPIVVNYSGINDGFSGYLKFEDNGKVVLLYSEGDFKDEGVDTTLFTFRKLPLRGVPTVRDNVYEIILATRYEIQRNANSGTRVKHFINLIDVFQLIVFYKP